MCRRERLCVDAALVGGGQDGRAFHTAGKGWRRVTVAPQDRKEFYRRCRKAMHAEHADASVRLQDRRSCIRYGRTSRCHRRSRGPVPIRVFCVHRLAAYRDRDACHHTPPAQIPAGGIPAPGSHLGCLTASVRLATAWSFAACPPGQAPGGRLPRSSPWTCFPGSVSGACRARSRSPRPFPWLHRLRQQLPAFVRRLHSCKGSPPSAAQTGRAVFPHPAFMNGF